MHFLGFMMASFMCYMIWDLDEVGGLTLLT